MASVGVVLTRPKGWWRLWIVFTLVWIGWASVMAFDQAHWSDRLDAGAFEEFSRGEGASRFQCISSSIDAPARPTSQIEGPWESDPIVEADSGARPSPPVDTRRFAVSCLRWPPILAGSIAAVIAPLFLLLMALATVWGWRGFRPRVAN
jgi:hypothetical protein